MQYEIPKIPASITVVQEVLFNLASQRKLVIEDDDEVLRDSWNTHNKCYEIHGSSLWTGSDPNFNCFSISRSQICPDSTTGVGKAGRKFAPSIGFEDHEFLQQNGSSKEMKVVGNIEQTNFHFPVEQLMSIFGPFWIQIQEERFKHCEA